METTTPIMLPQKVSDAKLVFSAGVSDMMPAYATIPDEFKRHNGTEFNKLVSKWFFGGLKKFNPTWKEGIDGNDASRHIKTVLSSFEPKHEHKEAAVAYLLSEWTDGIDWEAK